MGLGMQNKSNLKPKKEPTQERSRETVDVILEAATRIIADGATEKITTQKIAEVAGVSVGSLYQYFPGKDALVLALIRRFVEKNFQSIDKMLLDNENLDLEPLLRVVVDHLIDLEIKNQRLGRVIMDLFLRVGDFELLAKIDTVLEASIQKSIDRLQPKMRSLHPSLSAMLLLNTVRAFLSAVVYRKPEYLKTQEVRDELVRLLLGYVKPV